MAWLTLSYWEQSRQALRAFSLANKAFWVQELRKAGGRAKQQQQRRYGACKVGVLQHQTQQDKGAMITQEVSSRQLLHQPSEKLRFALVLYDLANFA